MTNTIKQNIRLAPTRFYLDVIIGDHEYFKSILRSNSYYEEGAFDFEDVEISRSSEGAIWTLTDKLDEHEGGQDVTKFLMWIVDGNDMVTLSHEIIHITWEIKRFTNIKIDQDNQEFQCYMHDYIMEQILEVLK